MEQLLLFKEPKAIKFKCPFSGSEDRIKQAFSALMARYRLDTEPFYGKNLKYKLTGKDLEAEIDRFFNIFFGNEYCSSTDECKSFDFKLCGAPFSLKGFRSQKRYDKTFVSIAMNRSASFFGISAKKEMFNSKLKEAPYQMCVTRSSSDDIHFKFTMFIFESSCLSIPEELEFKKITGKNKSHNNGYGLNLNDFIRIRISSSASDQFSVDIKDLDRFFKYSNAAILYKDI